MIEGHYFSYENLMSNNFANTTSQIYITYKLLFQLFLWSNNTWVLIVHKTLKIYEEMHYMSIAIGSIPRL